MKYRETKEDKALRHWFSNEFSQSTLRRIYLHEGQFRGLTALDISFDYPIAAIAGKNGSGKSTVLALACCAYHNTKNAFKLPKRVYSYYTFSDFFIQHRDEQSPQGVTIFYGYAHDNWKKTAAEPESKRIAMQARKKKRGGRWNDYDTRLKRTVVFLGIDRIVPHSERSQSRSYAKAFTDRAAKGWEDKVRDIVGNILNKTYDQFRYLAHSKYTLPIVEVGGFTYSGFNMGAGENALFEIFSTMYSCEKGGLLVLDEIELGLHALAQRRLMESLKAACLETNTQIICTTHSSEIFDSLPDDSRFFIEQVSGKTKLTQGISSEFAFAKLGGKFGNELDVFVEDEVGRSLLLAALPAAFRARLSIKVIGSAAAIARQLAAIYLRKDTRPVIAVFDGDQKPLERDNLNHAKKMAEKTAPDFDEWFKARIAYLPGNTWPESWIVQKNKETPDPLAALLGIENEVLAEVLEYGLQAGKHSEFYEIARHVGLDRNACLQHMTTSTSTIAQSDFQPIVITICSQLDSSYGL